jgi:hypothetical protein
MNKTPQLRRHALNAMNVLNVIGGGKISKEINYSNPHLMNTPRLSPLVFLAQKPSERRA